MNFNNFKKTSHTFLILLFLVSFSCLIFSYVIKFSKSVATGCSYDAHNVMYVISCMLSFRLAFTGEKSYSLTARMNVRERVGLKLLKAKQERIRPCRTEITD